MLRLRDLTGKGEGRVLLGHMGLFAKTSSDTPRHTTSCPGRVAETPETEQTSKKHRPRKQQLCLQSQEIFITASLSEGATLSILRWAQSP